MRIRVRELDRPLAGFEKATCKPAAAESQAAAGLIDMIGGSALFGEHLLLPEEQEKCYRAISDLRRLIGDTQHLIGEDCVSNETLLAMRAACRRYLDAAEDWDRKAGRRHAMPSYRFYQLLGAFRDVMGIYLWRLADLHDLDVDGRLASFFPAARD